MAFPIPSFLQFAPPEAVLSDIAKLQQSTQARQENREINLAELGMKRQAFAAQQQARADQQAERSQEMAFREMSLQRGLTADAAKMAMEQAKMDEEARIAMVQFQGMQNFQRDIAAGIPTDKAILKNIPQITFGNPAAFSSFANTQQRTKTQAESTQERLDTQRDLRLIMEEGLNRRLGTTEEGKDRRAEADRQARLEAAMLKLSNVSQRLSQPENARMNGLISVAKEKFKYEPDKQAEEIERITKEFEALLPAAGQPTTGSTPQVKYEVGKTYKNSKESLIYKGGDPTKPSSWDKVK